MAPQDEPVQLIRVSRQGSSWRFEVNDEAVAVLERYGQRHIAVCTVCGPYRTGKSYLLNLLLGRIQQGDVAGDGSSILFMDCEGFGSTDADKTRDAKLMALCLVISSVFMLNTKGVLNEGLFNALSLVCHLAEHVEERGQESSKPALLWMLRDFVLELRDDSGRSLSPDQYLEQALRAQPLAGPSPERSRAALEVRECLLRFFPERHCATLVQPVIEEEQLRRLAEVPYEELRSEFRGVFEAMQAQLLSLARANPKTIGGRPLGASALVGLLRTLVDALNSDRALDVSSAWDQVQHSACTSLLQELRSGAALQIRSVRDGGPLPVPGGEPLPVRDDVLAAALREGRRALREEWSKRAVGDEAVRAQYWQELKKDLLGEEKALEQLNARLAEEQLQVASSDWEAWLTQEGDASAGDARSESLALLMDRGMPSRPAARAVHEALHAARMARIRWDGSLDAVKAELKLVSEELASKAAAAQAAGRLDDMQLEQQREVGRLRGQVDALQDQAREAIRREKGLREQVLEAEDRARKEQRSRTDAEARSSELEGTVRDLEARLSDLQQEAEESKRAVEEEACRQRPRREQKPRCTCNVM